MFNKTIKNVEWHAKSLFLAGRIIRILTIRDNIFTKPPTPIVEQVLPGRQTLFHDTAFSARAKEREMEPFLVGLSPSTIAFKLGSKITRLLNKYRARKLRKEQRQEDWAQLYSQKPVEGVNHPEDVASIKKAKDTIGDFKLKTGKNYKVPQDLRESTVSKYKQLLEARLTVCVNIVQTYNDKVAKLRWKKERLISQLTNLTFRLELIHEEIPQFRRMKPPTIPVVTNEDYPEREMEVNLKVESDFQSYLRTEKPRKVRKFPICNILNLEKISLGIDKLPNTAGSPRDIIIYIANKPDIKSNPFEKKIPEKDDVQETFMENEIKHIRLAKKIHEQTYLIEKMNKMIDEFDRDVQLLFREHFQVQVNVAYMELHILVLNQELIIVKEFEGYEQTLSDIAMEKWTEMMDERDSMKRIELEIERHNYNIEGCQEQIKVLQQTFLTAAKDNKFWDFLRRIFKKKYRPPKATTDDDESSSSSSSSSSESEEDDAGSLDSRDIGPIRLDESVCPKGCDKEMYDYTFVLRSRRHDLEKQIGEERKFIEGCKKELDQASKKVKMCDQASRKATNDLEEYRALKQKSLNEVKCLVLLRLSQLRHLNPDGYSVAKLSDTLIFGVQRLQTLYKRVGEIQLETLVERTKHRNNKIHLHRMNMDCQFMNSTIAKLKKDIHDRMKIKFGSYVKVDEIEESILRRMILNLRISMLNLGEAYEQEINRLRQLYGDKQLELKHIIQENTARLDILSLLNKEKAQLAKLLENQAKLKVKSTATGDADLYYIKDIDKLKSVVKSQEDEIQMLKTEIKALSTKSLPPKPITHPEKMKFLSEEPKLFESLDKLYEPPDFPTTPVHYITFEPKPHDKPVTQEEIVLCVQDLMKETVEAVSISEKTQEDKTVLILSEIVEQIPADYLQQGDIKEYMSDLLKDVITDAVKEDSTTIIRRVSQATSRSAEEIAELLEPIFEHDIDIEHIEE